MSLLIRLALNALALLIVAWLFEGIRATPVAALIAAVVLGFVNTFIKPIVYFLTLPINFLTLGIFGLVVNAVLFKLISMVVPGFEVHGFFAAFFGAIVLSIVSWVLSLFVD